MSIAADLRTYLLAQPAIAAIVADRIEHNVASQGTAFPRIVLSLVSGFGRNALDGRGNVEDQRWQIDCQATTAAEATTLAEAVQDALDGYLGPLGSTPEVAAELLNQFDDYDEPRDGSRGGVHRLIQDYQLLAERS